MGILTLILTDVKATRLITTLLTGIALFSKFNDESLAHQSNVPPRRYVSAGARHNTYSSVEYSLAVGFGVDRIVLMLSRHAVGKTKEIYGPRNN